MSVNSIDFVIISIKNTYRISHCDVIVIMLIVIIIMKMIMIMRSLNNNNCYSCKKQESENIIKNI